MKNALLFVMFLVVFANCKKEKKEMVVNEVPLSTGAKVLSMGDFIDNKNGHEVSGKAFLVADSTGKTVLRLENFSTKPGPDVNVYLSKTTTLQDAKDLGDLKGTMGNMNYEVNDIDTNEYKYVLIWCVEFAVLFGHAELAK